MCVCPPKTFLRAAGSGACTVGFRPALDSCGAHVTVADLQDAPGMPAESSEEPEASGVPGACDTRSRSPSSSTRHSYFQCNQGIIMNNHEFPDLFFKTNN